eukprot:5293439-Prymnesium_polylepis.1
MALSLRMLTWHAPPQPSARDRAALADRSPGSRELASMLRHAEVPRPRPNARARLSVAAPDARRRPGCRVEGCARVAVVRACAQQRRARHAARRAARRDGLHAATGRRRLQGGRQPRLVQRRGPLLVLRRLGRRGVHAARPRRLLAPRAAHRALPAIGPTA